MTIERALRTAIESGTIWFGVERCMKALKLNKAKMLVLAKNCPAAELRSAKVRVHDFAGTNAELGHACGKKFPVSALVVIDEGSSNILSVE